MLNAKYRLGDRVQFVHEDEIVTRTIVSIECGKDLSYEDFKDGYPCPLGQSPILYGVNDPLGELLVWEYEVAPAPLQAIALPDMATA